jgi:tetratricopeptide (TPR) repeat protein
MEILVRLAGVLLGPYTEEQVRGHIADGLLSFSDRAKIAGTASDQWDSLAEVLADIAKKKADAPPEPAPEPEPEVEAELQPEPEAPIQPEPPAAEEPGAIAEEEAPEPIRRAPIAPPGVLHLPSRLPETEPEPASSEISEGRKTHPIGPSFPLRPTSSAPFSPSIVTTKPLSQTTKKVARAALVKALASGTSPLPTKAIPPRPPTAPNRPAPAIPPPVPKFATPPPAVPPIQPEPPKAKTVPMRDRSSAPPMPPSMPTTAPLPTRFINKPATGKVPPPAVPPIRATPPPLAQKPAPAPIPEALPPPEAPRERSLEEELEVPTVRMPTPILNQEEFPGAKIPPKPRDKPTDKPLDKPVDKPTDKPAEPPVEPKPTAPRRRLLPKFIGVAAVLAALMSYYVWSPYHAASALKTALDSGDAGGLDANVDFAAVRDSLKAQIKGQVWDSGAARDKTTDYTAAMDAAISKVNNSIDAYVTPQGIAGLVGKAAPATTGPAQQISPDAAAKILLAFNTQPVNSEGLGTLTDFVIDRGVARVHMAFTGLGWTVKQVELRPDLLAAPAANTAPPLLAPVLDTYMAQGSAEARNGAPKDAIDQFSQVIAIDPKSATAYNERATVREASGDPDGAIKDYTQALTIDPQLAAAFNGRGNARSAKNDVDGAIADFTQAIQLEPSLATAYDSRGNARIAKGDPDGAISDFTQAVTIDPNLASAYSDRGFARQANNNLDGAVADYTQALALKPNMARTYYNRALAREAQGNLDAAIVDFNHALDFDPKLADAYYHRANAKSNKSDLDGAIADYTQALALNPKNAQAYNNRGLAHQAKGDLDPAVADYTQALKLNPKIANSYLNRAVIEAQRNDLDDAIADSTQAIYIDPRSAQAYSTRGFAKLTKGNLDGAFTDLKVFCDLAARDHDADHARLYTWLIAKAQNSGAQADQDLSTALESSWNSSPDEVTTKTANFLLGRVSEPDYMAAATSPDAKTDQAQHCIVWYFVGMKRALMGDKKGAIDAFQQCVNTQQKDFVEYVLAQTELAALNPPAPPAPAATPALPAPAPTKGVKTD